LIESEPDAKMDLITDCLNTHQSESLVRTGDLGIKVAYSEIDEHEQHFKRLDHRVVFHTPNILLGSIKLKFGLAFLVRKLLLRASFIRRRPQGP